MLFIDLSTVPLAEGVVYHIDSRGWLEVKGVEEMLCVVVRDTGCEVGVVVYVEYRDRVK